MIVCICNNISEGKIHQAVHEGATSMADLRHNLGVATSCGKCQSCAKRVLKECLDRNGNGHHHSTQAISFHRNIMPA